MSDSLTSISLFAASTSGSNYFVDHFLGAAVTLFVGLFALYLYAHKKRDFKREQALLIWHEIKYAENVLADVNPEVGIPYTLRLLPSESWSKSRHLFLLDLQADEIERVTVFYARCKDIDLLMDEVVDQLNSSHLNLHNLGSISKLHDKMNENGTNKVTHERINYVSRQIQSQRLSDSQIAVKLHQMSLTPTSRIWKMITGKQNV